MFRAKDKAGNISNPTMLTIKKDTEAPFPNPTIEPIVGSETKEGIKLKIKTESADNLTEKVTYDFYAITNGIHKLLGSTKEKIFEVKGLEAGTEYTVYARARDDAGNMSGNDLENIPTITITTGKGIKAPKISLRVIEEGKEGRNGWYRGAVEVTIAYETENEYEDIRLVYDVVGAETIETTETYSKEVKFIVENDGVSTISAYTANENNETSRKVEEKLRIDTIVPNPPTININGIKEEGKEWYRGNIQAQIIAGSDIGSGTYGIQYNVTGAQMVDDKEVSSTRTSLWISEDGTSFIAAYTIDNAGNISEKTVQPISKNRVDLIATLSVKSYTEHSITVEATGTDGTEGEYTYTFSIKRDGESTYTLVHTETINGSKCEYVYDGLDPSIVYNLQVTVRKKESVGVASVDCKTAVELLFGTYIDYKIGNKIFNAENDVTGYMNEQELNLTDSDIKTFVWKIDSEENKMYLISYNSSKSKYIYIRGYTGYNNSSYLLDKIANAVWSRDDFATRVSCVTYDQVLEPVIKVGYIDSDWYSNILATWWSMRGYGITHRLWVECSLPRYFR